VTDLARALQGSLAPPDRDPPLPADGIPAAVLVPVLDLSPPTVLLTRRSDLVRDHKGEISFPGGVRDPEDPDLVGTALREVEEELGIPRSSVEVVGALPPTHTIASGYVIVPFVGLLAERPSMVPSPVEIAETLELELDGLAEVEREVGGPDRLGRPRTWHAYEIDGHLVWGATGRILHTFIETLRREGWWATA
jgi:8-oxo-dGTP pyrophosphatase MutT (NUDIX family)